MILYLAPPSPPWWQSPEWWTAIATGGLFVATGLLWLYTARMWRETRRAGQAAEEGLKIARDNYTAANPPKLGRFQIYRTGSSDDESNQIIELFFDNLGASDATITDITLQVYVYTETKSGGKSEMLYAGQNFKNAFPIELGALETGLAEFKINSSVFDILAKNIDGNNLRLRFDSIWLDKSRRSHSVAYVTTYDPVKDEFSKAKAIYSSDPIDTLPREFDFPAHLTDGHDYEEED